MDATQMLSDSILESDEEDDEEEIENKRGRPLAKLCILKNKHIPEAEFPLFLGDNVLGRDPNSCTVALPASSVSKQHATICLYVYQRHARHSEADMEALVWDLGSMNGTRKGRLKLTPNVRYALSEGDSLVVADIPCQFVSCGVDSPQGATSSPLRQNSAVKTKLPDASGEKGDDTSTDSKKCVIGGTETPIRASCLIFEQTPHQPKGTLVPESDSDSDSETVVRGERRRKTLVSDSDSHKSSPISSSFLSPPNKVVPESEDDSPITVSSSSRNKSNRHGSFTTQETDADAGRQQLEKKKAVALVEDSEEEEERAVQGGTKSMKVSWHMPVEKESHASLTGGNELSTPAVSTDAIPAFNMDSDTDVEGEDEEVASAGPVTLNTNQQVDQPPKTAQFHNDSDTDIDEDDEASGKDPKALPSCDENAKTHAVSVIPPEGITADRDPDVDDDAVLSGAATKAGPTLCQSEHTADSAFSVQPKDFHLDSDTDVDEMEEEEAKNKTDETPNKSDIKLTAPESAPAAPDSLQIESDTDDEALPSPALSKPSVVAAVADSRPTADADADLGILSDSDTDVEDASPLAITVGVTTLSASPSPTLKASQADSDADTDVDESSVPPAGDEAKPADVRVDGDTENKKSHIGEEREDQVPGLHRENTPGLLAPLLHNCSTPVQMSEGEVEAMETQAFVSPSSGSLRRAAVPAVRPVVLSPCSDSQEDEDFVVAETQSFTFQSRNRESSEEPTQAFILESSCDNKNDQCTKEESFQLGLSDSSHLQCPDQALAMENTQAFVSVEGGVNLEDTQAYAAVSAADRSFAENDENLEATQDYVEDEESERCQVDVALEATQAYIAEPYSHAEDDTDDDTCETQPSDFTASSTLAMAETQPMLPIAGEEDLATENPVCSVQQNQLRSHKEDGAKAAEAQEKGLSDAQSVTETQPMCASDSEESDDEGSFPAQRNRRAKPLPLQEAETQDLTCSELSLSETQPMHGGINETQPMATCEDDDEDSMPVPRKRKGKQLHLKEEETPSLTNSELSIAETQPIATCDNDGDEDSMPGPRKKKAKQLQPEEETQPLASSEGSALETQPLSTNEGQQSDEEDVIACTRKRKAKPLQLEEEQTQPLSSADVETPAVVTGKCDDKDSIPGPRKRRAKQLEEEETQPVDNSDITPVETQTLKTKTGLSSSEESEAGTSGPNLRVTRAKLREEEDQAECPGPSKRQTRGRSGKPSSDGDNNKEVVKRARGKKIMKQQKHDVEEEDVVPVRERNKQAMNKSLIKEQEDGKSREEEDAADLRQKREKNDKERRTTDEREKDQDEIERQLKEEEEKLERERRVNEEQERLQAENAARAEREIKEKEKQEKIDSERIEREERERLEREEKERLERERKEQEKEMAKREQEERLEREQLQAKLEREEKEREEREKVEKEKEAQEKQLKELEEKKEEQDKSKTPSRGRRAARRTIASLSRAETEQDSTVSTNDDFPARGTRSRSNSSNSVSSERSSSSVHAQESKGRGRGRGRGTRRTSETPQTPVTRSSHRRTTVAAGAVEQEPDSSNSLTPEISSCSVSSHNRGRGGRQRGRARKTEHDPASIPSVSQSQSDQNSTPTSTARGRKGKKAEESSNEALHKNGKEDCQRVTTTRERQQASAATDEEDQSKQEEACTSEESLPKRNVRGRSQRAVNSETAAKPVAPVVSDDDEGKDKRKATRDLEANTGANLSCSKGKERSSKTAEADEEEGKGETNDEIPVSLQGKKRGRASTTQTKKSTKESLSEVEKEEREKMEGGETVEKKVRGRQSAVSRKKKEKLEESGTSATNQDANVEASEPQTPTSKASRKQQAPANFSPVAKTPRSSSASPAASGRLQAAGQAYKVLFTGVMDEAGEKVLARLGGSMAKGVGDMNCLVTDKVRRTVKFLCALAKGVPIVTTDWLEKSGKAGSFLSPSSFIVKDPEQEKKFNFSLHESLRIASSQPLLKGYEVHVTKSVKPEPLHMKDIISSSGATFLPKMPSSNKPHTVVISCEEDWPLCRTALSASLPVVTAEFILTGILQQKLDFQSHTLSPSTANLQPAGGRGRGRRKT